MAKLFVRHYRKQRASVMAYSFADRPSQCVVAPVSGACLGVRRDIGSHNLTRQSVKPGHVLTGAFHAGSDGRIMLGPIARRMADHAWCDPVYQILPPCPAFRSPLKHAVGEGAGSRTKKRTPPDRP